MLIEICRGGELLQAFIAGICAGVLIYYCFFEEEPKDRSLPPFKRDRDSH